MRRLVLVIAALAVLAAVGAAPGTAVAGCPGPQTVMASGDPNAVNGYMCAYEDHLGDASIGAGETHSYNVNADPKYLPWQYCSDTTSSSVTVTSLHTWGTSSSTATNWLTAPNTRHWTVGNLWTAGGYYVYDEPGCSVSDQTWDSPPAVLAISSIRASGVPASATAGKPYTITVTVSPSSATGTVAVQDAGLSVAAATLSGGTATLKWTPAVDGTSSLRLVYAGDGSTTPAETSVYTVPVSGGTGLTISAGAGDSTGGQVTVTASPSTTAGGVAVLDVSSSPAVQVGKAALSGGSAQVAITYPTGSTSKSGPYTVVKMTLVAVYQGANPGQSYPYAFSASWCKSCIQPLRLPRTSGIDSPVAIFQQKGLVFNGKQTAAMVAEIPERPEPPMRVVTATRTASAARPTVSVRCAPGTHLINLDTISHGPVDRFEVVEQTNGGARVATAEENYGHRIGAQAICRPARAPKSLEEGLGLGTIRSDVLITAQRGAILFGGPGRDRLQALGPRSSVFGGLGADTIVLGLRGSTASGGIGDDVLVASGRSALLVGGPGSDTLVGPYGPGLLNAADGAGGDTVVCRSAHTRVMADPDDDVSGSCRRVTTMEPTKPMATAG